MKLFDKAFWIVLSGCLIALNIYSFYQKNDLNQELINTAESWEKMSRQYQNVVESITYRENLQYRNEGESFNEDLRLTSELGKKVEHTLHNLLADDHTLIFDLAGINCIKCSNQDFEKIIELTKKFAQKVGPENVLLISHYQDKNDLNLFKRVNNLDLNIYNKEERTLDLPVEEQDIPYMFLADSTFKAQFVFIPDENLPTLSEDYFRFIEQKF